MSKNSCTKNMLAMYHIDRGVNVAQEMELMITNLKFNSEEFDEDVATKLERLCEIIKNCFHDCYESSEAKNMSYDEIILRLQSHTKEDILNKQRA